MSQHEHKTILVNYSFIRKRACSNIRLIVQPIQFCNMSSNRNKANTKPPNSPSPQQKIRKEKISLALSPLKISVEQYNNEWSTHSSDVNLVSSYPEWLISRSSSVHLRLLKLSFLHCNFLEKIWSTKSMLGEPYLLSLSPVIFFIPIEFK